MPKPRKWLCRPRLNRPRCLLVYIIVGCPELFESFHHRADAQGRNRKYQLFQSSTAIPPEADEIFECKGLSGSALMTRSGHRAAKIIPVRFCGPLAYGDAKWVVSRFSH